MSPFVVSLALLLGSPPVVDTEAEPRTQLYVRTTPPGARIVLDISTEN